MTEQLKLTLEIGLGRINYLDENKDEHFYLEFIEQHYHYFYALSFKIRYL